MNQGDFDSLRGSCTAPSNKHVCFTGSRYNYVCKVWGIHKSHSKINSWHVWTSLALQTLYPKCEGVQRLQPRSCHTYRCGGLWPREYHYDIVSVYRHDHWWFCQREVLTSYKGSKPPDSLCNERLVSRLQHWVKDFIAVTRHKICGGEWGLVSSIKIMLLLCDLRMIQPVTYWADSTTSRLLTFFGQSIYSK